MADVIGLRTQCVQSPDEQWAHLWSLVNNASIREVFYQYLVNCVDMSVTIGHQDGKAPMTSAQADAAAKQCPVGV